MNSRNEAKLDALVQRAKWREEQFQTYFTSRARNQPRVLSRNWTYASDAEREETVARLRDAEAEGRLTVEEMEARVTDALRARFREELAELLRGLPQPSAPPPTTRADRRLELSESGEFQSFWGIVLFVGSAIVAAAVVAVVISGITYLAIHVHL